MPGVLGVGALDRRFVAMTQNHELRHALSMTGEGMDLEFTELAGERHVLRPCDVLVAKEQHLPIDERIFDPADSLLIETTAQVDVAHLGTDRWSQGSKSEHGFSFASTLPRVALDHDWSACILHTARR